MIGRTLTKRPYAKFILIERQGYGYYHRTDAVQHDFMLFNPIGVYILDKPDLVIDGWTFSSIVVEVA